MNRFHSRSASDLPVEAAAVRRLLERLREAADHDVALYPEADPLSVWLGDFDPDQLTPGAGELVVYTSGTTGAPKPRSHAVRGLFDQRRKGGPEDSWLLCYSPCRWAGLSVVRHVVCTGAQLVAPASLDAHHLCEALPRATHLSLTPSLLRKLASAGLAAASHVQQVTLGGEWASQAALDLARRLFPNARISHVYASTELGDICAASDGLAGFPVERMPDAHIGDDGELHIRGAGTGDIWEIRGGRFMFVGRAAEQISVGGALVAASVVEEAALSHPDISQARAYAIPNAILGQAIALEYVGEADASALQLHLAARLSKVARPMKLTRVETIALSATGKISREARP